MSSSTPTKSFWEQTFCPAKTCYGGGMYTTYTVQDSINPCEGNPVLLFTHVLVSNRIVTTSMSLSERGACHGMAKKLTSRPGKIRKLGVRSREELRMLLPVNCVIQ
jgi:hypothetical protein